MFGSNENQFGDNEKDRKKRDKEDINVLTANSYSYAVIMTYIYQKKYDITDCLEFLVLFHLHHFLYNADDISVLTTHNNYYNLNIFDVSSKNSSIFSVNARISINTTNIQKNIYKTSLTKE